MRVFFQSLLPKRSFLFLTVRRVIRLDAVQLRKRDHEFERDVRLPTFHVTRGKEHVFLFRQEINLRVKVNGVDVFHPNTGEVRSDGAEGIACWFIDTDYNEESFFVRHAYFLGANDPYSALKTTLKAEINAVTRISQARLLATAIHLRHDIAANERELLLKRWEKVSFRIYGMLGNDARLRVGEYVRLAWRVVNEDLAFDDIDEAIGEIGADFPIEDSVDGLRQCDCYDGWENELRYFMFRYEEHLSKIKNMNFSNEQWAKIWLVSPAESIEHIWAQSQASDKHRNRLGNLVLLPPKLNSTLQDLSPAKKEDAYRKTGLLIAVEVADRIDDGAWNKKAIDDREEALVKWAISEWAD